MKTKLSHLLILFTVLARIHSASAQVTAFNYSGQLDSGGNPANGSYDLAFTLYNAGTNGTASGALTNLATPVSNGLFNATLDFGGVFNGSIYWLQIAVRTNGGGAFTNLNPRQQILPTPYAIYAPNAGSAASANSVSAANITGTVSLGQLPGAVVTNNGTGVVLSGTFAGNANGLTGLSPANLSAGTAGINISGNAATATTAANATGNILDSQLSAHIARLNGTNNFTGTNNFLGTTVATNANNLFNGSFTGNGGGLTNLNATVPSTINESNITIGATNVIAPLTVPPNLPASAIGSVATGSLPYSIAVAGRYAYVGSYGELQIFDVSTLSAPVSVGSVATGSYFVTVAGRYAYVGTENGALQVFDVSNPSAPVSVGSVATDSGPASVAVVGHYAYVANVGACTLQIFDVSNPSVLVSVSSVGTVGGSLQGAGPNSVTVVGRYAYVVCPYPNALQIFDISNPSAPVSVGSFTNASYPESVAVSGRYAYVANEGAGSLQVFDVSNPSTPTSVGSVGTSSSPQFVAVAGRYAYVASNAGALQIIDVSNPSAPVSVGSIATGSGPRSIAVAGRYAYVVNENTSTLQIFDLGGAYVQQLEAGTIETGTLQTRDSVTVGNNLNVRGGLTASGSALINGGLGVNGSVGIGVSAPSYTLQVNGSIAGVGAYNNVSDARYKTNITRLTHALDKIMALRGVEYDWRSNAYPQMKFDSGTQLGFVAQEIKQVLPEVVSQDAQGYYSIAYSKVIPVLVEAIKDQQAEMKQEMAEKNGEIQELKQRLEKLEQLQKNGGAK